MFGYDEELPAGFQDADLETRELERAANETPCTCTYGEWITPDDRYEQGVVEFDPDCPQHS